ncbi:MAG TPA: ABC transporter permease [Corynebacterium nuruki]|jgi:NitT/TauT family transport system permease protein|uniref:ABC transporter permease n=1 Tax=Corynebacterium nuruki TaxID=1032851 RepID=A0A3D4SX31_9CORY|nr:ABC transporter permease [Corynebacterium nuruki]
MTTTTRTSTTTPDATTGPGTDPFDTSGTSPGTGAPATPETGPGRPARIRRLGHLLGRTVTRAVVVVIFLAIWEIAPRNDWVNPIFLPPLSEVLQAGWTLTTDGTLADHLGASLSRSVTGFAIAAAAGILLGLLIGWYRFLADLLTPILEIFRNTAALALLPVVTLLLGIGEVAKISLVVYAALFPVLLNTLTGVRTVDPLLIRSARSLDLRPYQIFAKVVLPSAVPSIFTGLRMGAAASILVLVAAEMIGAKSGLGYLIQASQLNFRIADMYVGIIAIAALGLIANYGLLALQRRLSRWR